MNNEIERHQTQDVQTHLGDRHQIAAVRSRIATMMQLPADVPNDVVWAAAQLAVAHQLNPFTGEIYIIPLGKQKVGDSWVTQYRPHIGVKGLRTLARRRANFMTDFTVMEPDEVQSQRRDMYDPDDVGVRCTLWRLDVARECKDAGIPYKPVQAVGFWRKKARYDKRDSEWKPDNMPETWTAQMVAEKRAEINALKQAFDISLEIADPATTHDDVVMAEMEYRIVQDDRVQALPMRRDVEVDEDGMIIEAPVVKPPARTNGTPAHESAPLTADVDMGMGDNPFVDAQPWYAQAKATLTNGVATLAAKLLDKHRNSAGPVAAKPYGYLVGLIDGIVKDATGSTDGHKRVLAVMCQAEISRNNTPGVDLADTLLEYLPTHIKDAVTQEKMPNPNYNEGVVRGVVAIYRAAESVSTPKLIEA